MQQNQMGNIYRVARKLVTEQFPARYEIGPLNVTCQHCHALQFPDEKLQCCMDGKVTVADCVPVPNTYAARQSMTELFELYTTNGAQMAKTFERRSGASTICLALQACK